MDLEVHHVVEVDRVDEVGSEKEVEGSKAEVEILLSQVGVETGMIIPGMVSKVEGKDFQATDPLETTKSLG